MKQNILVIALLIVGVWLRVFNWQAFPFAFDQVQILENAQAIANGHFTLIGPRTGPAPLFTGPLIYYLNVPFIILFQNTQAIIVSSAFIYLITGLSFYLLLKRYLKQSAALIGLALWSVSAYLIFLDRFPWNPNLCFLAAALIFFPLNHAIIRKKIYTVDLTLVALGIFLGYQAHFSGLFLLPLSFVGLVLTQRATVKHYLICLSAFLVTMLPALLFDLRHQWLHLAGIKSLLTAKPITPTPIINRLSRDLLVGLENGGKFVLYPYSFLLKIIAGISVLVMHLYQLKPSRRQSIWMLSWIIGIPLLYSLYAGNKPDYYYSIQFPVWLYLIISLITAQARKIQLVLIFIVLALSLTASWRVVNAQNPLGLTEQLQIADFINRQPPKEVIYHMPHTTNAGLVYLIQPNAATTSAVIVEYPKNPRNVYIFETKHFGVMP